VSAPRRLVVEGGTEHPSGHVVVDGDRILAVGPGPCPEDFGPARLQGGPAALSAHQALALGTAGGARCLGHADVEDPVAALVLDPPAPLELLQVGGRSVVVGGELRTGSEQEIARDAQVASRLRLGLKEVAG
jgi:hypothetical protein